MITVSRTMRHGLGGLAEPAVRSHNIRRPDHSSWWLVLAAVVGIALMILGVTNV